MNNRIRPANPFVASSRLEDLQLFVGREEELGAIAERISDLKFTIVNIVGARRIGKSSLLYHFYQTWEQRVKEPQRYVVIYLSLQEADCQTEIGFYQAVAIELLNRVPSSRLQAALSVRPFNRQAFSEAMTKCKEQNVLPILCLDGFEGWLRYPQQFNDGFYDNLRSLMDSSALKLIISSCEGLGYYAHQHWFTSSFFNVGHTIPLGKLTKEEAIKLVALPNVNSTLAALSPNEQDYALLWGNNYPYLLQLAGWYLWEAHQQNRSLNWAKQQFAQNNVLKSELNFWEQRLIRLLLKMPKNLSLLVNRFSTKVSDFSEWVIGIGIIFVVILTVVGVLEWKPVAIFMLNKLGVK